MNVTSPFANFNHSAFDIDFIQKHARMIVDMRNMVEEASENVYKL